LQGIIAKFPDVLTEKLGLSHVLGHEIQLKDPLPVGNPHTGWRPLKCSSC